MDCPRCGTVNMGVSRFCRRCGENLEGGEAVVVTLGALNSGFRPVRSDHLQEGQVLAAGPFQRRAVNLGNVAEAFLEAARHYDSGATIRQTAGGAAWYDVLIEGAGVVVRCRMIPPYAWVELRGPGPALRRIVRRVVERYGRDLFAPRDGNEAQFVRCTGVKVAENERALQYLLT